MLRLVLLAALSLVASGCEASVPPAEDTRAQGPAKIEGVPASLGKTNAPTDPGLVAGRTEEIDNELYGFDYAYPAKVAAIPGLKAVLDKRLDEARAELEADAKADRDESAAAGYPYRKHEYGGEWKVVTDLPGWLSLSAVLFEYSGGAHGMTFFDTLLWDRHRKVARSVTDLFASKAALSSAIREPFCAALDKEREKRRGEPVNRASGEQFDECIDPVEHTIILGSSNGRTFDRLGVMVEPYAAGPYAEGSFDITLPVTKRILDALKPEYRSAFSIR